MILKAYGISRGAVENTIRQESVRDQGKSLPRPGRPISYTPTFERRLLSFCRKSPKATHEQIRTALATTLSKDTVHRILKKNGLTNWIAKKRPFLTLVSATVYHAELDGVAQAVSMLLAITETETDARITVGDRTAVIYTDNQSALKTLRNGNASSGQAYVQAILSAVESLAKRGIETCFQWIPSHKGIEGNEMADQRAKQAAQRPAGETQNPRFLSAIRGALRVRRETDWRQRWSKSTKGRALFDLAPEPDKKITALYQGREKAKSSLLVQLRTGKIGFNEFLFKRRVPEVTSPRCTCGLGAMTVRHVLLSGKSGRNRVDSEGTTP